MSQQSNFSLSSFFHYGHHIMGRFQATTTRELRKKVEAELRSRRKLAAAAASLAGHAIIKYSNPHFNKARMHTSILSGEGRMQELLSGHAVTFYNEFGMSIHVFHRLVKELHQYTSFNHSKHISMVEQLGIFLWICRKGASVRDAMYHFQHSPDTISKYVSNQPVQLFQIKMVFQIFLLCFELCHFKAVLSVLCQASTA